MGVRVVEEKVVQCSNGTVNGHGQKGIVGQLG